jgi:galactokinase
MTTPLATGHPVDLATGPLTGEGSGIRRFLSNVYGEDAETALTRYRDLEHRFRSSFGDYPSLFVSAPGRVEIGGNHTDHNNGRIIAASVTLDSVTAAGRSDDNTILLSSAGYPDLFRVSLEDLRPVKEERGTTAALIRGIAARCAEAGYAVGGFRASVESQVKPGSGLSSSASIEMLIGMILNTLYNRGRIPIEDSLSSVSL